MGKIKYLLIVRFYSDLHSFYPLRQQFYIEKHQECEIDQPPKMHRTNTFSLLSESHTKHSEKERCTLTHKMFL